ncbi:hypothetical protein BDZ94DRAFT_1235976 [Collybia nuda]|uniref:WW domain-containing protein n=1 Tax=Collybia nuda TaxID=64659 RepID=A0A9P5Y9E0_9AGAR|nr:hypothetical protein BDZ94DRAFT_1235976 [Collybia nuda]
MSLSTYSPGAVGDSPMPFIETATYQRPFASGSSRHAQSSRTPPDPWKEYKHPNGDIYFYNRTLRLITPDDIYDPTTLAFVLEAREDHLQCLESDSSLGKLADDWEMTLSDVSETAAVIRMYSRRLGESYVWTEERGLEFRSPEHFWSHVAEYPSHHDDLPPNTEGAFVQSLMKAKQLITQGEIFPFSATQIDQVIKRYEQLKGLQSEGRNVVPALAWLMGAVMPLDACGKSYTDQDLGDLMKKMRV